MSKDGILEAASKVAYTCMEGGTSFVEHMMEEIVSLSDQACASA